MKLKMLHRRTQEHRDAGKMTKTTLRFECPKCGAVSKDVDSASYRAMKIDEIPYYNGKCPKCSKEWGWLRPYKEDKHETSYEYIDQ